MIIFLCNVFLMFFVDNLKNDCVLRTLFMSTTEATKVLNTFENYVTVSLLFSLTVLGLYAIVYSLSLCVSYYLLRQISMFITSSPHRHSFRNICYEEVQWQI